MSIGKRIHKAIRNCKMIICEKLPLDFYRRTRRKNAARLCAMQVLTTKRSCKKRRQDLRVIFVQFLCVFTLVLAVTALLASCAPKEGVTVDGRKVSIAESKCSIKIDENMPEESVYDDKEVWNVEFIHSGDHDFSMLAWQANQGFAPSSEMSYYLSDGKKANILAGNIGNSRVYIEKSGDNILKTCKFEHKGYIFSFDFEIGEWTYSKS